VQEMKLHPYKTSGGKDLIMDYIDKLDVNERIDGLSVLQKLKNNDFDSLTIKTWQGKVLEVYFYKHNRIFYVVPDEQNIYLLHACRKQKNKTEQTDKDKVIKRAKELGEILSKKFI